MNLKTIDNDIKSLDKALAIIEKTDNYLHFDKTGLIMAICKEVNVLREKRDKQISIVNKLNSL